MLSSRRASAILADQRVSHSLLRVDEAITRNAAAKRAVVERYELSHRTYAFVQSSFPHLKGFLHAIHHTHALGELAHKFGSYHSSRGLFGSSARRARACTESRAFSEIRVPVKQMKATASTDLVMQPNEQLNPSLSRGRLAPLQQVVAVLHRRYDCVEIVLAERRLELGPAQVRFSSAQNRLQPTGLKQHCKGGHATQLLRNRTEGDVPKSLELNGCLVGRERFVRVPQRPSITL
mmetsp:Transcript_4128/g.6885  ORF Transcript_4128/g.6885 Transcript_4128/m.6885 type:complete len:235 (+) Transcript_4128:1251-1955(+)